jgi:hypothetical protein
MVGHEAARAEPMTRDSAEMLAIRALQHLAGDPEQIARFLSLSGIAPEDLREAAKSADFLSGVLDHLMGDESALTAFAASAGCEPGAVAGARDTLSRPAGE